MPFSARMPLVMMVALFLFSLTGCGEKTIVAQSGTKSEQAQACIECHQSAVDQVTGKVIVDEWKLSHHNTSNAAGCADCHDPEPGHPTGCNLCHSGTPSASLTHVSKNPDEDRKCNKCHSAATGLFPTGSRRAHYGNTNYPATFSAYTASYVSTNYIGKCRKCHNPHDPTSTIGYHRTWAQSGHGEVNVGPRTARDFKLYGTAQPANLAYTNSSPSNTTDPAAIATGTPVCVRCHTTTGFINFVSSNFLDVKPFGSATDKTKEVTGCDACHSDYSFKVRTVGQVKIYFNFSGATQPSAGNPSGHAKIQNNGVTFPDFGSSNICIPCHSGRGVGSEIKLLNSMGVDFAKINNPSSHDFTGAALLTAKSGYEFAGKEYVTGVGAATGHDSAGLTGGSGKGPCITCHLNKAVKSDSHTFKPVIHDTAQFPLYVANSTWSQIYSVGSNSPASLKISSITSQSCNTSGCHVNLTAAQLTNDKEGYISALAVLNKWVRLVRYVPANPQLAFNAATNKARSTTKWDFLGAGTGPDLMGAAFNLSNLNNEPGAYTHNPLYAKRLVYDSIYFLCTKATDPVLGTNQYPTVQQFNVADAIYSLTTTTAQTLETVGGVANTAVTATISTEQANAAINWLYGKSWANLSASEKLKRPGDN